MFRVVVAGPSCAQAEPAVPEDVEALCLSGSEITDLGALAGLTRLRELEVQYAPPLRDLSPLRALPALRRLELNGESFDFGGLAGSAIEQLTATCQRARQPEGLLDGVAGLSNLRELVLRGVPCPRISLDTQLGVSVP